MGFEGFTDYMSSEYMSRGRSAELLKTKNSIRNVLPPLAVWVVPLTLTLVFGGRASAANKILETMGVSIAVGAVLGASTLPFYSSPFDHTMNIAYGAGAGAAVGVGILVYGATQDTSDVDDVTYQTDRPRNLATSTYCTPFLQFKKTSQGFWDPTVGLSLVSLSW